MKLLLQISYLNEQYNSMGLIDIIGFSGSSSRLCMLEVIKLRQFEYLRNSDHVEFDGYLRLGQIEYNIIYHCFFP